MSLAVQNLSTDDQVLLVDLLLNQQYALELITSEINDIENGLKTVDEQRYKKLICLYDRLRFGML
ncbi:antirepressor AbbA [Bacillus lacus]|uniref:Antirepressor AbbA n=1 Tax=Metabacillus lacus TaxID=1983721 RepID=A0A7X2LYP4_9BACI|nr:antirepressor AbbA [Metabacillus lacus]MRX73790.1 antirepressor AbbA [Metabacillus lacus]